MKLSDRKKGEIVKALADKNLYQVGLDFGLDKHYKDSAAVRNAVYRIFQAAVKEPERYKIPLEEIQRIQEIVSSRTAIATRLAQPKSLREKLDEETNRDFKDLVLDGRRKAFGLLMRKLDRASRSNKTLDEINLSTLAQTFGIIFDKAQIISGEATENVAVLAKIDTNLKPEEALNLVLKMREQNQADKEKSKLKK